MPDERDLILTVFIVDDEAVLRDALRLAFQAIGLSVQCFSTAIEFLEFMGTYDTSHPACLIADIQLAETSGIQLLEQLRASGKNLPVIIITGHGTTVLKHEAESAGAAAFLEKPFRMSELVGTIVKILRTENQLNQAGATKEVESFQELTKPDGF